MISTDKAYGLSEQLRKTRIVIPNDKGITKHIGTTKNPFEVFQVNFEIMNEAADMIDALANELNSIWTRYMVYMDETEGIKDKLERAKHCINEINDQFERGKCSNDYVEDVLKEYYEND